MTALTRWPSCRLSRAPPNRPPFGAPQWERAPTAKILVAAGRGKGWLINLIGRVANKRALSHF